MLNPSVTLSVQVFAKEHKINRQKLESFIEKILSENTIRAGKPTKDTTKELRYKFEQEYENIPLLTSKAVSERFNVSLADANNCLMYFGAQGIIRKGEAIKVEGKRGRAATKWERV